ncbi:MAG: NAD(P)/FAD-dependent oxidoreductase [Dermatophilaceae bacterium]
MDTATTPRVVIVGGGFAGLFATRGLRHAPVAVTLVDKAEHHLFQPLLYQCATGILSEGQIAAPLRDLLKRHRNVDCLLAAVEDVDVQGRRVIAARPGGTSLELPYDYLILATGVQPSYFGHDEYAEWAPGMKTVEDALAIRRKVFGAFEMAETAATNAERRRWLTFALVGGGPTGVELAGQIRELATRNLRKEFRQIRPEDARVLLFDGGKMPLSAFGEHLSAKAAKTLTKLGVELHMSTRVTSVDREGLLVTDAEGVVTRYDAGTVLWTAGVEAPDIVAKVATATGAKRDRTGRIAVQPDLTIPGHRDIFVVGDAMSLNKLPGLAEVAMQSGAYAGRSIRHRLAGRDHRKPFRYIDLGSAAYIARRKAVVSAGPLHLSGFFGWLTWLFIHIAFLTGYRNRVTAVLTWFVAFSRGVRRERAFTTQEVETLQDVFAPRKRAALRSAAQSRRPAST